MNGILSAVIFGLFLLLLLIGTASTYVRWLRYRRLRIPAPVLLKRDAILLGGLAIPFLLISAVRVIGISTVSGENGPELWWLLVTGIPAVLAIAVYVFYELFVIEKPRR